MASPAAGASGFASFGYLRYASASPELHPRAQSANLLAGCKPFTQLTIFPRVAAWCPPHAAAARISRSWRSGSVPMSTVRGEAKRPTDVGLLLRREAGRSATVGVNEENACSTC